MGWGVEDDGLSVIFDKVIPDFITKKLPDVLNKFFFDNLDGYVLPQVNENYSSLQTNIE